MAQEHDRRIAVHGIEESESVKRGGGEEGKWFQVRPMRFFDISLFIFLSLPETFPGQNTY